MQTKENVPESLASPSEIYLTAYSSEVEQVLSRAKEKLRSIFPHLLLQIDKHTQAFKSGQFKRLKPFDRPSSVSTTNGKAESEVDENIRSTLDRYTSDFHDSVQSLIEGKSIEELLIEYPFINTYILHCISELQKIAPESEITTTIDSRDELPENIQKLFYELVQELSDEKISLNEWDLVLQYLIRIKGYKSLNQFCINLDLNPSNVVMLLNSGLSRRPIKSKITLNSFLKNWLRETVSSIGADELVKAYKLRQAHKLKADYDAGKSSIVPFTKEGRKKILAIIDHAIQLVREYKFTTNIRNKKIWKFILKLGELRNKEYWDVQKSLDSII